ncbi:PILR alpha-associated neural protein [Megalops cyprinoides]|uniref:PILR alpha-associated neural protein n=1 Tax=Megalops cyprinoides TaxID=118141 RepID=UPI001863D445|nr:PILR alpha-associated neural protein [Megalops cyprinoides]
MERCFLSPVARLATLCCLLVAVATRPVSCDGGQKKGAKREGEKEQVRATQRGPFSPQLSVTTQATPTPLWAVVWGPTEPAEDETSQFLSGEGMDAPEMVTKHGQQHQSSPTTGPQQPLLGEQDGGGQRSGEGVVHGEPEEVDPQVYVTVTISSLLIVSAIVITAKLCYDRRNSWQPPPLSHGMSPSLSLSLPCSLTPEGSRQMLQRSPSDRNRMPEVNL